MSVFVVTIFQLVLDSVNVDGRLLLRFKHSNYIPEGEAKAQGY